MEAAVGEGRDTAGIEAAKRFRNALDPTFPLVILYFVRIPSSVPAQALEEKKKKKKKHFDRNSSNGFFLLNHLSSHLLGK